MNRVINVVVVTTSYPIRKGASSGIFVKRMVESLPDDIAVKLVVPDDSEGRIDALSFDQASTCVFRYAPKEMQLLAHVPGGIPVAIKDKKMILLLFPFFMAMLCKVVVMSTKAQVLHSNWSLVGVIVGGVARIRKKYAVVTLRGEDFTRAKKSRLFHYLLWVCVGLNNKIVCVSKEMTDNLIKMFPANGDKITFIPNGVGDEFIQLERGYSNKKKLSVLFVGSLIPRKNVGVILKAMSLMDAKVRPSLRIVGDGQDRQILESMCQKLEIADYVFFCGALSPDDVVEEYASADIFVLPSFSEGRPNVLLEAMASGLPVVASRISGVVELIDDGENGFLFDPENEILLSEVLENLCLRADLRKGIGVSARASIVEKGNDWSATGNSYAQLYRQGCLEEH